NNNWAQLSKCTDGMKDDERGWASYYLASLNYFGLGYNSKLNDFISQRDNGGECNGGKQNFIAYLRTLSTSSPPGYDYSAQIMSKYVNSVSICDSDCPGK
ncbi:MAG: hypothetical protein NTV88_04260, partial [Candidatus Micrarchaeota archaeon]|nr:hypothetical protein [Candidatus Micrarchaeota archaeon]